MTLIYLAEPIDATDGPNEAVGFMAQQLNDEGYAVFRPATGFRTTDPDPRIDQINRHILAQCDLIVAYLDRTMFSIGVPAEIEYATNLGIPAVVYYTGESQVLTANRLVTQIDLTISVVGAVKYALENRTDRTPCIKVVLAPGAELPTRKYPDDAGLDLTTAVDMIIPPGQFVDVRTTVVAVELPPGYWGQITGRSSTLRKHRLHVPPGTIDNGWRGPLFVGVWNLTPNPIVVDAGTRLGQLILYPNIPLPAIAVDVVSDAPRGLNGFGSTGA